MGTATRTPTALLLRLRNHEDHQAWRETDNRFRPILIGFGRRLGLDASDAADAAQESLIELAQAFLAGRYDRSRGRLRSFVFSIARHKIADLKRNSARRRERTNGAVSADLVDEQRVRTIWDIECEHALITRGLAELARCTRVNPGSVRAFYLAEFHGMPPAAVAEACEMTVGAVAMARHHVRSRLCEIIRRLSKEYDLEVPDGGRS